MMKIAPYAFLSVGSAFLALGEPPIGSAAVPEKGMTYTRPVSIVHPFGGDLIRLTVTPSRYAGAFNSLTFRGVEYVDNFDHGRQLQSAFQIDAFGECLNPTEAGSKADGARPATSSIPESVTLADGVLRTRTKAAYWLAPGEKYGRACSPTRSITQAQNKTVLSPYRISRTTSFDEQISNLATVEVTFSFTQKHEVAIFEAMTGYLPQAFDNFLEYQPNNRSLRRVFATAPNQQTVHPVIVSTADGKNAMGILSPDITGDDGRNSFFTYFWWPGPESAAKWNCIFIRRKLEATAHRFSCHFAVGTVDEVLRAIDSYYGRREGIRPMIPIYRFSKNARYFYTRYYSEGASAGFAFEGTAFHLRDKAAANLQPIFRCYARQEDSHFVSARSTCNGETNEGTIGYTGRAPQQGLVPLYHFYHQRNKDHLITVDYERGVSNGYTLLEEMGYAAP